MTRKTPLLLLCQACLAWILFASSPPASAAVVGEQWTVRNPLPTNEDLNAMAANGTTNAVAVGNRGTILYTTTGTSWTPVTTNPAVNADLRDIAFNGTRYVAVGYGGAILWSYDGNNWNVLPPVEAAFMGLVWTGGQFIATGGTFNSSTNSWGGVVYTSPNGETWTRRPVAGSPSFFAIASNGTISITIANGMVYTSTNGSTWTKRTLPKPVGSSTANVNSIAWHNGQFILTGEKVWVSTNGINWTLKSDLDFLIGMTLRWSGSELIATHAIGLFYTSTDGLNWSNRSEGLPTQPLGGGRLGAGLLSVGFGGHIERQVSVGGWSFAHNVKAPFNIGGIATNGTRLVAVGQNISWFSTDNGATWTETYYANLEMNDVTWDGTQFIAAGRGAWRSPDGVTWTSVIPRFTSDYQRFFTVASVGGKTFASGYDSEFNQAMSAVTTDGTSWSPANMSNVMLAIATDGGKFVAAGWRLGVLTSTDGTTWTQAFGGNAFGEDFTSIVYGGGQFVAVSTSGVIYTSPTGTNWTARQQAPQILRSVIRTSNEFLAVGGRGLVVRSFDGQFWRDELQPTSTDFNDVLWSNSRLIAVGASGNIFTSDGTAAEQPTISISSGSLTMAETGGTATINVTLSKAWPIPVNVPLAFSGASGNNVDYTASATTVEFKHGDPLTKSVTLTSKNDVLDEPDETLTVTALQPDGDAGLGTAISHTLNILDDDSEPVFGAPLVDQLVAVGSPFAFSAPATGTVPITYQWKKGAAVVAGAKASTYSVAKAALSHAGEYSVDAKNISGTKTSSKGKLGVVTVSSQIKVVKAGSTVVLNASAAGAVSYQWRNGTGLLTNGDRITGATQPQLTLSGVVPGDSESYVCEVSLGSLTLDSATIDLGVIDGLPVISQPNVQTRVADPVDFTPAVSSRPHKWAISNLPPGLGFSATTGRITGKPNKSGTWAVKATATNLYGPSQQGTFNIVVDDLPVATLGTFVALLPRDPLNNQLGGRVEITTQSNGQFSGKVALSATSYGFKNVLSAPMGNDPGAQLTVARGRLPALNLQFSIGAGSGVLTVMVSVGEAANVGLGVAKAPATASRIGAYNVAFGPAPSSPAGTPEGFGYLQFKIDSTGSFNAAGRLADDTRYTVASQVAAGGVIPLFIPAYGDKGSVLGNLTLMEDAGSNFANNSITGSATWFKAATNSGRSYASGFELMTLQADGGRYTAPTGTQVVMNLATPVHAAFTGGNLALASRVPDNDFTVTAPAKVTAVAAIPAATSLKFDTTNGLFSGQFLLSDTDTSIVPNKPLPRTVLYSGVLIRPGGQLPMRGYGYFNLPQMPTASPKTTGTTSPTLSGAASLTPNSPP